jgi:hypothetical protein
VLSETKIQIPKNEHPAEEQLTINLWGVPWLKTYKLYRKNI